MASGRRAEHQVVLERPWRPRAAPRREEAPVRVRVAWGELELARQVQAAGGTWNHQHRVWELPDGKAVRLGLLNRIVDG